MFIYFLICCLGVTDGMQVKSFVVIWEGPGEEHGNLLQYSYWRIQGQRGWWATACGPIASDMTE